MPTRLPSVLATIDGATIGLVAVLGGAALMALVAYGRASSRRAKQAFERAAKVHQLSPGSGRFAQARKSAPPGRQWHGETGDFQLLIEEAAAPALSTSIRFRGGLPKGLALHAETSQRGAGDRETRIGDEAFDQRVLITGARLDVIVALDADARHFVGVAISEGWRLEDEELVGAFADTPQKTLDAEIQRGLRLATLLRVSRAEICADLIARVADDPSRAMRRRALEILATERYGPKARAHAITLGLVDPWPENRFVAAALGDDTFTLMNLASNGDMDALELLMGPSAHVEAARQALTSLVSRYGENSWAWRARLARALGRCPVPDAENALIAMLATPDDDLRSAAMEALAAIGTIAAVPALVPLRDALLPSKLKRLAAEVILAIQARAGDPDRGALALVDDAAKAGALALTNEH